MRAWAFDGARFSEIATTAVSDVVGHEGTIVWVDAVEPVETDLACIQEEFSLHPLALEDIRERHQRPKIETYPSHSFLVAYTRERQEIEIVFGPGWMVTVGSEGWSTEGIRARFERAQVEKPTVGFLLYVLLDEVVDGYFGATEEIEDSLEEVEERIFEGELGQQRPDDGIQEVLFDIRRRLLQLRRVIVPLRDVVHTLIRRDAEWVDDETATHLQDVYDHVLRVVDQLDSLRELTGNAVDAHLAVISNRVNDMMKRMTAWGAILLGATLVAGIYGMNFVHMPELGWRWGYPYALGLIVVITLVGYRWFRRRSWL